MSEAELKRLIKKLQNWIGIIITAAVISIVGLVFTSIITRARDSERVNNIEKVQSEQKTDFTKTQEKLQSDINSKADMRLVLGIKQDLENRIIENQNAINKQLDIIIKMMPTAANNYNYKTKGQTNQ